MTGRRWSTAGEGDPGAVEWLAGALPHGRVLNIGAGGSAIRRSSGLVVNVDHVRPPSPFPPFVVADASALPWAPGAFAGALLKDVVEHVDDPLAVLWEVRRVVHPGGRVVITVPRAIPRAVWSDVTHKRGFTAQSLTQALLSTGWSVVAGPSRLGGFPGAGRLGLTAHLLRLMKIPGFGHYFGTNWWVLAEREVGSPSGDSPIR
jgi:SAM-dependent methyltransferase